MIEPRSGARILEIPFSGRSAGRSRDSTLPGPTDGEIFTSQF